MLPASVKPLTVSALKLKFVPVSIVLVKRAVTLASDYDVAVYDAAFVALAEEMGASFITADQKLVRRMKKLPYVHSLKDSAF